MTDACNVCGKTSSMMNCKRCKSVTYCSVDCQRRDWKTHKAECKRKEFAGAPCGCCGDTENLLGADMCVDCGFLFCKVCSEQQFTRDLLQQGSEIVVSFEPCPGCHQPRDFRRPGDWTKLEKLIRESPADPRLAHWLVHLGEHFLDLLDAAIDDTGRLEQKAIDHFTRAGELGFGEGFTHIAEMYLKNRNWNEATRYYRMAADRMHVGAICSLATEAALGYHKLGDIIQEDHRRPPDWEEAFRLFREGAQLGHPRCSYSLGVCYYEGNGTEVNHAKSFKWFKRAAEKGDVPGIHLCALCYLDGEGVGQSNEQAIYWFEKYLELVDDEDVRTRLQELREDL